MQSAFGEMIFMCMMAQSFFDLLKHEGKGKIGK